MKLNFSFSKKALLISTSAFAALAIAVFVGLRHSAEDHIDEEFVFPAELSTSKGLVGCRNMVQSFCGKLYSPDINGNLKITDTINQYSTLQGNTRNDFDQAWYAFYRARLKRQDRLPKDLRSALERRGFFDELPRLLKRPSRGQMQFESSVEFEDLETKVDTMWDMAIEETISRRLERKFPGSFRARLGESPLHVEVEKSRLHGKLWSEISLALWKGHPNWKKVEADFDELKKAFLLAIADFQIDDKTKFEWSRKVSSVRLALPGENPITANPDCVSVTRNAYYYRYLNTITVCAGYFTGGAQILTLAHEIAHSLDISARLIDVQQNSQFARSFLNLKKNVCAASDTFDCTQWQTFKSRFDTELGEIGKIQPEEPELHSCLQKAKPSKAITPAVVREKATEQARRRFSEMTSNGTFFRLINREVSNSSGKKLKNPSYLNPCANETWDSGKFVFDSELPSKIFFVGAFRCSSEKDLSRLRAAFIESKELTEKLLAAVIENESIFSAREDLQSEGYSSPPTERFADRIGSHAVAKYLQKFDTTESRRSAYLASSFWICEKPSLKSENYDQYQALSEFIIDKGVHPENERRITDWLSPPVQTALGCEQDFEPQLCKAVDGN